MAGLPGSIPSMLPAGQDELVRRMRDLERRVDELGPSVAKSFLPMLATVIVPEEKSDSAAGFPITTTLATQSTLTFTVPAGYTKMVIVYTAECEGLNSCVDPVSIELYPLLTRSDGGGTGSGLWRSYTGPNSPSGANALVSIAITDLITGLTAGGTVTISAQVDTFEAGFGSLTTIDTSALVLWMR